MIAAEFHGAEQGRARRMVGSPCGLRWASRCVPNTPDWTRPARLTGSISRTPPIRPMIGELAGRQARARVSGAAGSGPRTASSTLPRPHHDLVIDPSFPLPPPDLLV
ncbi:hypothetical protein [Actinomadura sp. KC216]|uniref:hypothetical protein n=1 Tax=Actinomadura sp. KC216 TaxID=2530370 RepID=UPI001A9EFF91|nr:hypothetical protein [Actinomadura sp. KC216]